MSSDATIREDVADELDYDPKVNADGVGVAVKNGIVTLSGHVPNYAHKIAAVAAAKRVRGVKAIAQDLTVRLPHDGKHDDDEIAQRAVNILKWNVGALSDVKVVVDSGHVSLSGEAPWHFHKQEAEASVRRLSGVVSITNNIKVTPRVQPSEVREKIARAMKRTAELETSAIRIEVDGSKVTLSGRVKAWYERKLAEDAAWSIPGVTDVHDHITL